MRDETSASGFTVGVITGAVVGAGIALLFAPKSGVALREELGASMTGMRDAVAQRYLDLAARAGVELHNLQDRVDAVTDVIESGARDFVRSTVEQEPSRSGRT